MALMPMPPMPRMWNVPSSRGMLHVSVSSGQSRRLTGALAMHVARAARRPQPHEVLDEIGKPRRRIGPALRFARRRRPSPDPQATTCSRAINLGQPLPVRSSAR